MQQGPPCVITLPPSSAGPFKLCNKRARMRHAGKRAQHEHHAAKLPTRLHLLHEGGHRVCKRHVHRGGCGHVQLPALPQACRERGATVRGGQCAGKCAAWRRGGGRQLAHPSAAGSRGMQPRCAHPPRRRRPTVCGTAGNPTETKYHQTPTCHAVGDRQGGEALKGGACAAELNGVLVSQRHQRALGLPAAATRTGAACRGVGRVGSEARASGQRAVTAAARCLCDGARGACPDSTLAKSARGAEERFDTVHRGAAHLTQTGSGSSGPTGAKPFQLTNCSTRPASGEQRQKRQGGRGRLRAGCGARAMQLQRGGKAAHADAAMGNTAASQASSGCTRSGSPPVPLACGLFSTTPSRPPPCSSTGCSPPSRTSWVATNCGQGRDWAGLLQEGWDDGWSADPNQATWLGRQDRESSRALH